MKIVIPENIKREWVDNQIERAMNIINPVIAKKIWRDALSIHKLWFPDEEVYKGLNISGQLGEG